MTDNEIQNGSVEVTRMILEDIETRLKTMSDGNSRDSLRLLVSIWKRVRLIEKNPMLQFGFWLQRHPKLAAAIAVMAITTDFALKVKEYRDVILGALGISLPLP